MCGPIEQPLRTTCPTKNPAFAGFFESGRPDLNRGPHRPERCALPGCATPRGASQYSTRHLPPKADMFATVAAVALAEIINELDALLEPARFDDYCPNGLQVPGPEQVATVATGVSAHLELFELAA